MTTFEPLLIIISFQQILIMKKSLFNILCTLFLMAGTMTLITSCGDGDCVTCTIGGVEQDICQEDVDKYNTDNGASVATVAEYAEIIEQLGQGTCN